MILMHELGYAFLQLLFHPDSLRDWLNTVLFLFFLISGANLFITFPVIFNFFIIPNIEKRFRKKLVYKISMYQLWPKFIYKNMDISLYIASLYVNFMGKMMKRNSDYLKYALYAINYQKYNSRKIEVIMSFLVLFNLFLGFICLITGYSLIPK